MPNTTPIGFVPAVSDDLQPWETAHHIRLLYQAFLNAKNAIQNIKLGTTTETITENNSSVSPGPPPPNFFPFLGTVNDQRGNTAYLTELSDNGAKIILADSSPIVVTLNASVGVPWFTFIDNDSSATATLTPSSGSLIGEHSIPGNGFGIVFFDGVNFFCGATQPLGISATVVTAALTLGGTQGSMQFINGQLVAQAPAT